MSFWQAVRGFALAELAFGAPRGQTDDTVRNFWTHVVPATPPSGREQGQNLGANMNGPTDKVSLLSAVGEKVITDDYAYGETAVDVTTEYTSGDIDKLLEDLKPGDIDKLLEDLKPGDIEKLLNALESGDIKALTDQLLKAFNDSESGSGEIHDRISELSIDAETWQARILISYGDGGGERESYVDLSKFLNPGQTATLVAGGVGTLFLTALALLLCLKDCRTRPDPQQQQQQQV